MIDILFVDDDRDILDQAKIFLEKKNDNLNVSTISSSEEALEILEENDFDCVVSDYRMPTIDGLDFLEIIREEMESEIPFIIITGKGREEVAMEALNLGADKYLQKVGSTESQFEILAQAIVQEVHKHEIEKLLLTSEERYRRMFETAQDGMLILNADTGEIKDANPFIQDILGYSKDELVGKELWELGTFRNIAENRDRFEELVEGGFIRYEDMPLETKDGDEIPVEFVSNTYEAGNERVLQCNIREISDRKRAEEALEHLVRSISGQTGQELFDSIVEELTNWVDADGAFIGEIQKGKRVASTLSMILDGEWIEEFEYDLSGSPSEQITQEGPSEYREGVSEKFPEDEGLKEFGAEGYLGIPVKDKDGEPLGVIGVFSKSEMENIPHNWEDLMEIVASRASAEIQRRKAEKREKFLHSMLRHDLRNKIQVSVGYGELLKDKDLDEEARELVEKDCKAKHNASKLIEDVRKLRKAIDEELKGVRLCPILESTLKEYELEAEKKGIEFQLQDFEYEVKGGNFMDELFSNLVINSIKHSEGSILRVRADKIDDRVTVIVEDDGVGIPDEKKESVFEKGYSNGSEGGSGFGLYLVKEIAKSYSGNVEVKDSELGGARFDVCLELA